jgi:hypothetical protein
MTTTPAAATVFITTPASKSAPGSTVAPAREAVDHHHAQTRARERRDEDERQPRHPRPRAEGNRHARAQGAAARDAERQGLGQGVAEHRLQRRADDPERRAHHARHQHARQA